MSNHPDREAKFVDGYHEERTEHPHAQQNLRRYAGSGIWDQSFGLPGYAGFSDGYYYGGTGASAGFSDGCADGGSAGGDSGGTQ